MEGNYCAPTSVRRAQSKSDVDGNETNMSGCVSNFEALACRRKIWTLPLLVSLLVTDF